MRRAGEAIADAEDSALDPERRDLSRHRVLRKTKVIATIGPACDSPEMIKALIQAGMNVARLNFSHGSHEEHRKRLGVIRQASDELHANVATMLDTKGVEIRTGRVAGGGVELRTGSPFTLHTDDRVGDGRGVSVSYRNLPGEVSPGSLILIDDGAIELRVVDVAHATRSAARSCAAASSAIARA